MRSVKMLLGSCSQKSQPLPVDVVPGRGEMLARGSLLEPDAFRI